MLKLLLTSYSDSWSDLEKVSKCPRAAFTRKTTLLVTHIKAVTNEWNFFCDECSHSWDFRIRDKSIYPMINRPGVAGAVLQTPL